jgi:hypothetical protein
MENKTDSPPSPTSSEGSLENVFSQGNTYKEAFSKNKGFVKKVLDEKYRPKINLPKLSFPQFTGKNPSIWKDKCQDYFKIFDIPSSMWATYASMNMDDNAAKWVQMYKKRYGLGDCTSFITAMEKKFGDSDYRAALTQLLDLHQEDSLENYITTFEDI